MAQLCEPDWNDCRKKCCFSAEGSEASVISYCDNPCGCYGDRSVYDPVTNSCGGVDGFFAIVNVNSAKDDNFNILFNDQMVGTAIFSYNNEVTGYFFHFGLADADLATAKAQCGTNVVWRGTTLIDSIGPSQGDSAVIDMVNAGLNYNGNYGLVYVGRIGGTTANVPYNMSDGGSQSFPITWP